MWSSDRHITCATTPGPTVPGEWVPLWLQAGEGPACVLNVGYWEGRGVGSRDGALRCRPLGPSGALSCGGVLGTGKRMGHSAGTRGWREVWRQGQALKGLKL